MKIPKFITIGLVSGALRLRPEVMDVITKLSSESTHRAEDPPGEEHAPEPSSPEKDPHGPPPPPCRNQRRLVVVSPLPGRWIRWSCLVSVWATLCLGQPARAVVMAKGAPGRISPDTVGSAMFTLPEGTMVNIVRSHRLCTLVCAPNGQRRWVSRDAVQPVIGPAC